MQKNLIKALCLLLMAASLAFLMPSTTLVECWPVEDSLLGHNDALFTLGALAVRPFGLCMALGTAAGLLLMLALSGKRAGHMLTAALITLPCAVIGGHLVYCLTMLSTILSDFTPAVLWQLPAGGYTLYGAVLGGLGGLLLASRITGCSLPALADAAVPAAALAVAVGRGAEVFIAQGLGDYVENEALWHFPLLICTYPDPDWPQWQLPVFIYEALIALVLLAVALVLRMRLREGRLAQMFVALLGVTQVVMESLRRDEFIRFGFVRFSQLAAAVTVAAVLFLRVREVVKARGWTRWQIARVVVFVLCVGLVILLEFALDKSPIDNRLLYAVMIATETVMGAVVLLDGGRV